MLEQLGSLIGALNSLSPLAVIGGLIYIVYLLISKRGPVSALADNHLHSLPDMAASLERIELTFEEIRDGIHFLKGRSL